ncbi:unnamed protein product, partial [Meganyctiphanes norvegica]
MLSVKKDGRTYIKLYTTLQIWWRYKLLAYKSSTLQPGAKFFQITLNIFWSLKSFLTFYLSTDFDDLFFIFQNSIKKIPTVAIFLFLPTFLNLLGGALLGCWPLGFPLCCVLTAIGASCCFLLSRLAGKNIIQRKFRTRIDWLQEKVWNEKNLMSISIWLLNLSPRTRSRFIHHLMCTAPILDIIILLFFSSVFSCLIPYNFLCVQAGEMLSDIKSMDDIFTPKRLLSLITLTLVMLTLTHFSKKRKPNRKD